MHYINCTDQSVKMIILEYHIEINIKFIKIKTHEESFKFIVFFSLMPPGQLIE